MTSSESTAASACTLPATRSAVTAVPVAGSQIRTVASLCWWPARSRRERRRDRIHGAGVAGEGVSLGAGGRVPDPHGVVASWRWRARSPSGAIADRIHGAGVAGEGVSVGAGGRVPDPRGAVAAGGGEPGAVGAIATAVTPLVWPVRVCRSAAGGRVPDPGRAVVAGGGEPGRRRGRRDRVHPAGVAGEGVPWGAGGRVPDPGGAVVLAVASQVPSGATPTAATRPVWPVRVCAGCRWPGPRSAPSRRRWRWRARSPSGANATAITPPVWPVRVRWLGAGGRVPDPHRPVVAGGGEPGAVGGDGRPHSRCWCGR